MDTHSKSGFVVRINKPYNLPELVCYVHNFSDTVTDPTLARVHSTKASAEKAIARIRKNTDKCRSNTTFDILPCQMNITF